MLMSMMRLNLPKSVRFHWDSVACNKPVIIKSNLSLFSWCVKAKEALLTYLSDSDELLLKFFTYSHDQPFFPVT